MILTPLMDHQKRALNHLEMHGNSALFMCLGSGKSLVALAYAEVQGARRILITSDKNNVVNTWPDEIYRHTDWEPDTVLVRPTKIDHASLAKAKVVVTNYDQLKMHKGYRSVGFDMWIGDESAQIKDHRTDRAKAVLHVVKPIPTKVLLNGRAATEKPEDLFGQMLALDEGSTLGRNFLNFRGRYMQPSQSGYGWELKRSGLSMMKQAIGEKAFWMESEEGFQLPKQEYHLVHVRMHPKVAALDSKLARMFAATLKEKKIEVTHAASLFTKRHQLTGGVFKAHNPADPKEDVPPEFVFCPKLAIVKTIIEQNPTAKIVVWHTYKAETRILHRALSTTRASTFTYEGPSDKTTLEGFAQAVPDIQPPYSPVVLLIRNSMCRGLNQLRDVDVSVFYSNPFSYAQRAQAEGRARRLSSATDTTHYIDIITDGAVDEKVYYMLKGKRSFSLTLALLRSTFGSG